MVLLVYDDVVSVGDVLWTIFLQLFHVFSVCTSLITCHASFFSCGILGQMQFHQLQSSSTMSFSKSSFAS